MSGITGRLTMALLLLATSFAFGQQWTQLDASGPSSRRNAAAIYDPVGDRMILFGGRGSSGDLGDVWAFDLADDSWERIQPDAEGPTPRFTHNAVYDATGHRMLIWSGRMVDGSGSTLFNDVWASIWPQTSGRVWRPRRKYPWHGTERQPSSIRWRAAW